MNPLALVTAAAICIGLIIAYYALIQHERIQQLEGDNSALKWQRTRERQRANLLKAENKRLRVDAELMLEANIRLELDNAYLCVRHDHLRAILAAAVLRLPGAVCVRANLGEIREQ